MLEQKSNEEDLEHRGHSVLSLSISMHEIAYKADGRWLGKLDEWWGEKERIGWGF